MTPFAGIASRRSSDGHLWSVELRRRLLVFILALVGSTSLVRGQSIPDTANRLIMAEDIERSYLDSLGLRGQSAATAVEKMLAEGFRCRIEVAEEYVPEGRPMWYCVKRPSGNAPPCDELRVALRFAPPAERARTRDALLVNLENIKVASARASCPAPRSVSSTYLAARSTAEKSLATVVDALGLNTSGEAAYGKLLREGFYCGFVLPGKSLEDPKMECTKLPSSIEFCYEAKVVLEMKWPDGVRELKQLYRALPSSRVMAWRTTCEIPSLEPVRRAPI